MQRGQKGHFTAQAWGHTAEGAFSESERMASRAGRKRLLSLSPSDTGSWFCRADGLSRLQVPSKPPAGPIISQVCNEPLTWILVLRLSGVELLSHSSRENGGAHCLRGCNSSKSFTSPLEPAAEILPVSVPTLLSFEDPVVTLDP